ncbi:MAG: hypothetical protein ABJN22_07160 [Litorimonas sp.]
MKLTLRSFIAIPVFAMLSACASTPDPAEVCSAEWIAPRATKAVGKIEKRAKSSIKTLRKVSETWASGKTPGPIQMFRLSNALDKMKKELTDGQGIRDLKIVAKTCNDPEIIKDSMRDLLERQGVSDSLIRRVESRPIYESLISSISEPDPVNPNS